MHSRFPRTTQRLETPVLVTETKHKLWRRGAAVINALWPAKPRGGANLEKWKSGRWSRIPTPLLQCGILLKTRTPLAPEYAGLQTSPTLPKSRVFNLFWGRRLQDTS